MDYTYLDNAYWDEEDRQGVRCIRISQQEKGRKKDVLSYKKLLPDGTLCPNYKEVVAKIGIEKIDRNTEERHIKKQNEDKEKRAVHEQQKKSAELEMLFQLKLQAFEIDEIKNCEDRQMRTRLRRAKNPVELNAVASLIIGKELGLFDNEPAKFTRTD